MTMLYPNPCYNEACYKATALYYNIWATHKIMVLISDHKPVVLDICMGESSKSL